MPQGSAIYAISVQDPTLQQLSYIPATTSATSGRVLGEKDVRGGWERERDDTEKDIRPLAFVSQVSITSAPIVH